MGWFRVLAAIFIGMTVIAVTVGQSPIAHKEETQLDSIEHVSESDGGWLKRRMTHREQFFHDHDDGDGMEEVSRETAPFASTALNCTSCPNPTPKQPTSCQKCTTNSQCPNKQVCCPFLSLTLTPQGCTRADKKECKVIQDIFSFPLISRICACIKETPCCVPSSTQVPLTTTKPPPTTSTTTISTTKATVLTTATTPTVEPYKPTDGGSTTHQPTHSTKPPPTSSTTTSQKPTYQTKSTHHAHSTTTRYSTTHASSSTQPTQSSTTHQPIYQTKPTQPPY